MDGLVEINLKTYIEAVGDHEAKDLLASFLCPMNADVQEFLRVKAFEFSKQGITQTHLVFASYQGNPVLVGYYSLTNKVITVKKSTLSATSARKIAKFGTFNDQSHSYIVPAPLIAQLGKNYANGYHKLISGDVLLALACQKVKHVQLDIGGKIVYLECEDKPKLIEFYARNGFCNFGKRMLDKDERDLLSGDYLIQMMKYLK
jgi:hypothetical protein